jgi:hypothetical protein
VVAHVGAMRSRAERVSTRLDRAVACMRGSSRDLTRRCALWSEAAVHATLEGEAVPRRHVAKRAHRHTRHGGATWHEGARWWRRRRTHTGASTERCEGPLAASAWPQHCSKRSNGVLRCVIALQWHTARRGDGSIYN